MSEALRNSTGSIGTVCEITKYAEEIEKHLSGSSSPLLVAADPTIEDPAEFAMEKHLEEFLVENWNQTELGRDYDIFEEDGVVVGQQYQSDTGPLDILAISKNKKTLLVVELKKGRATDSVVGQVLRYMGYVQEELGEDDQTVKGVIIAQEDDPRLRRALAIVPSIQFYKYQVRFTLMKA
jgi:restriction system protein